MSTRLIVLSIFACSVAIVLANELVDIVLDAALRRLPR